MPSRPDESRVPAPVGRAAIDSPTIRQAGRDVLSLALMDARNHTLHLLSRFEEVPPRPEGPHTAVGTPDPFAIAGHVGWFAEAWTARNTQRAQGMACPQRPTRLASLHPRADAWWDGEAAAQDPAAADPQAVRAYLLETLEATLELLAKTEERDDALYFYRLALFHEDLRGEQLVEMAQERGLALPLAGPQSLTPRPPLVLPATRWTLGLADGGFVVDNERLAHGVSLPECEMDAQPVGWAQYVEFVDDGGYDRQELWHPEGWAWLQAQAQDGAAPGGRAPRHVEQIGVASGSVMQRRFGQIRRMPGNQPVLHASWWEADAWCRWAGRRLPSEVEWERAACSVARQAMRWGDVWEWTGTTFGPYPGFVVGPWATYSEPHFGNAKVLRGGSFATRERMKYPRLRNFARPSSDQIFCGFRSCAL